jgi:cysteinyl-tRNA synthetase
MDDDFNTAEALAALFDLARRVNAELAAGAVESSDPGGVRAALEAMEELGAGVLGVLDAGEQVDATGPGGGGAAEVDGLLRLLVEVRDRLRAEKNYGLADHIRDSLIALGYEVQDGPGGTAARRRD